MNTTYKLSQDAIDNITSVGKVINDFVKKMSRDFSDDVYRDAVTAQTYFKEYLSKNVAEEQTEESIRDLYNTHCYLLHQIDKSSKLFREGSSHYWSLQALSTAKLMLNNAVSHIWDAQEEELDENNDFYYQISNENDFMSCWEYYELFKTTEINDTCTLNFDAIVYKEKKYKTDSFKNGHKMTWLDLWHFLDSVMKQSRYRNHIFIEGLEDNSDGSFTLETGS